MEKISSSPNKKEQEPVSEFAGYWRRFDFPFNPPKPGTPAEIRLKSVCNSYAQSVVNPKLINVPGSDEQRRALHNQLAVLVLGKEREELPFDRAYELTDFACLVALGVNHIQAEKMYGHAA